VVHFWGRDIEPASVFFRLPGGSKTFNVTSNFNATKSHSSAFKYFVTTSNHALLEVRNQEDGSFELVSLSTSGNAKVTVKAVAVERDVDIWAAESTFAVSVGNNAPTLEVALPDVRGTQNLSLNDYFKDDRGQLTYSLTVEDPNVVNATLVGSTLYVQNGLFRDERSLVTITASDGFASVNDTLNATYCFSAISFSYVTENVYEFVSSFSEAGTWTTENANDFSTWQTSAFNGVSTMSSQDRYDGKIGKVMRITSATNAEFALKSNANSVDAMFYPEA
jgi:hypothetical protein